MNEYRGWSGREDVHEAGGFRYHILADPPSFLWRSLDCGIDRRLYVLVAGASENGGAGLRGTPEKSRRSRWGWYHRQEIVETLVKKGTDGQRRRLGCIVHV